MATLLELVMVIANTVMASFATGLVENNLATDGGVSTVRVAVLLPVPTVVCVVVTPLAVFGKAPGVLLVTTIVTLQPPAGKFGTVRFSAVAPTVSAGEFVTPVQVPPITVELTLILASVSVKLALLNATALALASVKVMALVPPPAIVVGLKALLMEGLATTVRLTGPAPAPAATCVVVTPLTLLGLLPGFVLVTCTVTLQPPGGRLGTVRFKAFSPVTPTTSAGELVTPVQVPPIAVEAILILVSVSVKFALFRMPVLALPSANVIVLMLPPSILAGLNDFAIVAEVNGGALTIKFAEAVALVFALVDVAVPVVLVMPGEAAVTVLVTETLMLQLAVPPALKGTVAPLMAIEVSFATFPAVTVPPHVLVKLGVENTFMPAGKISLHATPVIA